jgi:hypothetical protein
MAFYDRYSLGPVITYNGQMDDTSNREIPGSNHNIKKVEPRRRGLLYMHYSNVEEKDKVLTGSNWIVRRLP